MMLAGQATKGLFDVRRCGSSGHTQGGVMVGHKKILYK
jgi:hypothetical protein